MTQPAFDVTLVSPDDLEQPGNDRLVDLIDGLLEHGVVISGEIWLSVADVDLVFLGLNAVLTTPDRVIAKEEA
ncbi:MAG: gas vesicle protein [Pseudomonadota bacterium]